MSLIVGLHFYREWRRANSGGSLELTFRETLPSDVERLFSVRARTRENPLSTEHLAELGITPEAIVRDLASGRIKGWICSHDSILVGFCDGDAQTGEILVLAVLPEYEGRGIGSKLLVHVTESLRSMGFTALWLAASSDPSVRAHGFYRSFGWRPTGEIDENGDEILVLKPDSRRS
jgi:ribosomal protein S18 acetylase RimI-like enzyme